MAHLIFEALKGRFTAKAIRQFPLNIIPAWRTTLPSHREASESGYVSIYHNSTWGATLIGDVVSAVIMLAIDECMKEDSGVVKCSDSVYCTEYHHQSGKITYVKYDISSGLLMATHQSGEGENAFFYAVDNLKVANKSYETVFPIVLTYTAALIDAAPAAAKLQEDFLTLRSYLQNIPTKTIEEQEEAEKTLYRFSDAFYFALKDERFKMSVPPSGNVQRIPEEAIQSGSLSGAVLYGNPKFINQMKAKAARKKTDVSVTIAEMKNDEAVAAYVMEKCSNWTDEEKMMIPSFDDDMPVPPQVVDFINIIVASAEFKRPVVQLGWRGTSGFGKSTGVEMIACILNKPLLRFTCSSTTERQDFLTQIVPDVTKRTEVSALTFSDIADDPESSYEQLTGKFVEGISCDEVMQEAIRQMAAASNTTPRYVMQESSYIRALKNGYICEIQECSRIRDAGVLPGLNEYDRPGALIPQVDGSYAKRHPDAIVFYTDNVGFRSCNELDPSVIRRIQYMVDSTDLPMKDVIERVIRNLHVDGNSSVACSINSMLKNRKLLTRMYDIWEKVKNYCVEQDLVSAGGCVTVEEYERWVQMTGIAGLSNAKNTCISCIVSKATSDYEEQNNIISSVISSEITRLINDFSC